ncbi:MAG: RluA family pseudouridine synthase [Clostridia bacterium]|nr:RluA family pseudouridine synthase [Clostridia bacterium]
MELIVSTACKIRIDKYIAEVCPDLTRSFVQKLIEEDHITANGVVCTKKTMVSEGDVICFEIPKPKELSVNEENIPLEIVYEDDSLIVVNKPRGMVVHPANGNYEGTLVNALLYHCKGRLSSINGVIRPGIVHRIDKDTSGLLLVAKTDAAHLSLAEQIKEHSVKREYVALLDGVIKEDSGTVDKPIGRSEKDRKKMAITLKNSKNAVTHYTVLERYTGYCLVKCRLETGRTHQIRVHMASLGHPVTGDPVYGAKKQKLFHEGQLLHAKTIGLIHPKTGEYMEFSSELPDEFQAVLNKLR